MLDETENIDHFRTPTTLHKREVTSKTEEKLLSKVYESHNAAQIRKFIPEEEVEDYHNSVEFNWNQFWVSFTYEVLPWVFISPLAVLLIERSRKKAWNVIQNRCLLLCSLKHNDIRLHIMFWVLWYPSQWIIISGLVFKIFDSHNFIRNIDIFHLLIGFCILTVRNLIVSIKYGYYRKEDYDILSSDPPYWDQSRTERRMVLAGWSSPEKYPGLIEDELTCTVDASNISVQGMSFILKEDISQFLRKIKTDELFCAKTKYNQNNEVTSGFLCHQIIKKSFEVNIPNFYFIIALICSLYVMICPPIVKSIFNTHSFGDSIYEIIVSIGILITTFQSFPVFGFGLICVHDFKRRFNAMNFLGKLISYPGIRLDDLFSEKTLKSNNIDNNKLSQILKKHIHVDLSNPKNVFAWSNIRTIIRSYGHSYYLRIQGYTSVFLCFVLFCLVMLNLIGWLGLRHHFSTIILLISLILIISIITVISIFKASNLQHESSNHRNLVKKELLIIEKSLIQDDESFNNLRKSKYKSKQLLKEVDEYINFEELNHNPTKILGYPADHNVLSSVIGLIITGFILALEGFVGSNISYDVNGWFRF
jgi:hypothetical protein